MTTLCPKGCVSEWDDWCSVCGDRLGADAPAGSAGGTSASASPDPAWVPVAAAAPDPSEAAAAASAAIPDGRPCPHCGEIAYPDDVFCESCGYDFASGTLPVIVEAASPDVTPAADPDPALTPAVTPSLMVTVAVDADFFAATTADVELSLPEPIPDTVDVTLTASRNLVGRHSESRGILPEIDVEAITDDPGVSSRHLMLERSSSGTWTFTDLGSTNGTYLSAEATADPITAGAALPVGDGLSLWLGAWTRLDLSVDEASAD
ncbi:MAG: FHA domain-containing protein [Actinomycetota bacterium]